MGVPGVILTVLVAGFSVVVYLQVSSLYEVPPLPRLEDTWWGPRHPYKEETEIKPFKINISDEVSIFLFQFVENEVGLEEIFFKTNYFSY